MDSIKYYLAISAACAFTLTPCAAKEAMGEALLQVKAPAQVVPTQAAPAGAAAPTAR